MLNQRLSLANHNSNDRFYNAIAPFYWLIDYCLRMHKKPLIKLIQDLPSGKLLSMGVGYGKELCHFHKHQVIGIDLSSEMLKKAAKYNVNGSTIRLKKMNAECTDFQNESFDYIVISHMLSVCDHPQNVLKEASRLLKRGGQILILNHFTPNNILQYFDAIFEQISRLFHFRSCFYLENIHLSKDLKVRKIIPVGRQGYYKLIQVEKSYV